MEREFLLNELQQKHAADDYIALTEQDETVLPLLLTLLETEKSTVKYLCEKIIRRISEESPARLEPFAERIAALLDSENNFIRWGTILTFANLLALDRENRWETACACWLSFLEADAVEAFGNCVKSLPRLLKLRPELEEEAVPLLLAVKNRVFQHKGELSPECKNVAVGHTISCIEQIYPVSGYQAEMLAFVRQNADNPRKQVQAEARRFLKKYGGA